MQEERVCWLGGTRWHDMDAMRISVSNWSTTDDDVDRSPLDERPPRAVKIARHVDLQLVEPDDEPVTFRIRSGSIKTVGRAPRADFVVDAPLVSRVHCQLTALDDTLQVKT